MNLGQQFAEPAHQDEKNFKNGIAHCRCPVCRSVIIIDQAPYRAVNAPFLRLRRKKCVGCGLEFAWPMPSQDSLKEYNCRYFEKTGQRTDGKWTQAFNRGFAQLRFQYFGHHQRHSYCGDSTFLEIGPGEGFLAEIVLQQFPQATYLAIETDTTCHPSLEKRGVTILKSSDHLPPIDLAILSHVLEHVSCPVELLTQIHRALKQRGLIFIEVPCHDYLHKTIDEPHLLFFDKHSMKNLLEMLGFRIVKLSYHGQALRDLMKSRRLICAWRRFRSRLLNMGIIAPFARQEQGLEGLSREERAVIKSWRPHQESEQPSWWLRAIAVKP